MQENANRNPTAAHSANSPVPPVPPVPRNVWWLCDIEPVQPSESEPPETEVVAVDSGEAIRNCGQTDIAFDAIGPACRHCGAPTVPHPMLVQGWRNFDCPVCGYANPTKVIELADRKILEVVRTNPRRTSTQIRRKSGMGQT